MTSCYQPRPHPDTYRSYWLRGNRSISPEIPSISAWTVQQQKPPISIQSDSDSPQEEKSTAFSKLRHFSDQTTIHGFKEIFTHWSSASLRVYFIILLLVSFFMMGFHMRLQIMEFINQPTTILTTTINKKSYPFPGVTFCPQGWFNVTKYHELGIPRNALLFALSMLKRVQLEEEIDVVQGERDLDRFMLDKNITTYFDLYLTLANDITNRSLVCKYCSTWPPKKTVTEEGVCYHVTFEDYKADVLTVIEPALMYNPISYKREDTTGILDAFSAMERCENLYVGTHVNDFFSLEPIYLMVNTTYILRITPMNHHFLPNGISACMAQRRDESKLMCEAYCHENYVSNICGSRPVLGFYNNSRSAGPSTTIVNASTLHLVHSDSESNSPPRLWSSLLENSEERNENTSECIESSQRLGIECGMKVCPPLCMKQTYATTVSAIKQRKMFGDLDDSSLTMVFVFQARSGIIEAREYMSYTWFSFLSNVGGLMGLWCGASFISIYHLFAYFGKEIMQCLQRPRKVHATSGTKEEKISDRYYGKSAASVNGQKYSIGTVTIDMPTNDNEATVYKEKKHVYF